MTKYHTFWRRYWAGFVDGLVFIPVGLFDSFLSSTAPNSFIIILWAAISYTSYWLYSVLLHARYGQTLGKMTTDVKVLDVSETRIPTFKQAVLRDSGYIVLNLLSLAYLIYLVLVGRYGPDKEAKGLAGGILSLAAFGWFVLEIVSMLTNDKRRAFHDFIAGTVVVRDF